MEFWQTSMPDGMSLKSEGCASSISDPEDSFSLSKYCAEQNLPYADLGLPVLLESFVSYGIAFQERFVPNVEHRSVTHVKESAEGFTLILDNGENFQTRKLILALGVGYFAHIPPVFSNLPDEYVTHSSHHANLSGYEGQKIAIIGAGSSALDLAALLNKAGAHCVILTRAASVKFHERQRLPRTLLSRLRAPSSGIGPGWASWLYCNAPLPFHYLPEQIRLRVTKTHLGPTGCWFTRDEVIGKVPIVTGSTVESATAEGDQIHLRLTSPNGPHNTFVFDHVIAATGYRVDVERIIFLDATLKSRIMRTGNAPTLSSSFESSITGLYFVGPAAANSFGPPQRFVVGARFAARRVSRSIASLTSTS